MMTLAETAQAIRGRRLSAAEAVGQSLDRIQGRDGGLQAFAGVHSERALARAGDI
ncbi:MAG: amidase, partial [bacterium]|nr:amidase [bacterium]